MFNMGMTELIVIFVIALIVFGPKRLPELGKSLGRAMSEFKRSTNELKDSLEKEVGTDKIRQDLARQQQELKDAMDPYKKSGTPAQTASASDRENKDSHAG